MPVTFVAPLKTGLAIHPVRIEVSYMHVTQANRFGTSTLLLCVTKQQITEMGNKGEQISLPSSGIDT